MSEYLTCGGCGRNYDDPSCHCLDDDWEEFQDHCVVCEKSNLECNCPHEITIPIFYPAKGEFPTFGTIVIINGGIARYDGHQWISEVDRSGGSIIHPVKWWCNLLFDAKVLK